MVDADGNDVNPAAGCLKAYFRELREPLFPIYMFDQFTDCTRCSTLRLTLSDCGGRPFGLTEVSKSELIGRFAELLGTLPRSTLLVLRYLFAFLNQCAMLPSIRPADKRGGVGCSLSEYSDENMMDPYNLAICFGPTLMPIPEGKDQVRSTQMFPPISLMFPSDKEADMDDQVESPALSKPSPQLGGFPLVSPTNEMGPSFQSLPFGECPLSRSPPGRWLRSCCPCQVLYHNHVNELMRNLIVHWEELFPGTLALPGPAYEKFAIAAAHTETSNEDDG